MVGMAIVSAVGAIMSVVGSVVSYMGQQEAAQQEAKAAKKAAAYNKAIHDYNAAIASQEADLARERAKKNVEGLQEKMRLHIGESRSLLSASGVDVNDVDSSPLDLFQNIAGDYASQIEAELWYGDMDAWRYESEAGLHRAQGELELYMGKMRARSALSGGTAALGSLISAGGQAVGKIGSSIAGGFAGGAGGAGGGQMAMGATSMKG